MLLNYIVTALVLIKPIELYPGQEIYGFTRNKVICYEPKDLILKNFPTDYVHRSPSQR